MGFLVGGALLLGMDVAVKEAGDDTKTTTAPRRHHDGDANTHDATAR
jgi:hypothetical protein